MSIEGKIGIQPTEIKAVEEAQAPVTRMDEADVELVRQNLIRLGVLAKGTPVVEQRKPYLGQ